MSGQPSDLRQDPTPPWVPTVSAIPTPIPGVKNGLKNVKFCPLGPYFSSSPAATVTLAPETAHPRLVLSRDRKSVRWEYALQEPPASPARFDADPCVLGREAFTSGRHCWVVDVTQGHHCAVGVSRESLPRKGPIGFNPEEGIWAVQQWGFKNRALTSPPTPLNLPRVPRKIRISLDYEWGEVAFFDVENKTPIFTFPPTSFAGERIRPWFCVELGSLSLLR